MSNSQVGGVYQQIINDVIAASRVDFEEGGIDEAVLEQLRKVSVISSSSSIPTASHFQASDDIFHH
jgi:transcription initiation factor TFIIA large subunit